MTHLQEFVDLLGADRVLPAGPKVTGYLRDFSWYSPILENALADTTVDAVMRPRSLDDLTAVVALAAERRIPLTIRGAGTGNYGQSLPLRQGIVVDIKDIAGVLEIGAGRIAVLPGTLMQDAEAAAQETGQEMAVMPSTYRVATASGFICGGSGGLGGAANGDLWDGNILAVEMLTVEEKPRLIRLEGGDVRPVLHTYGTIGVVTRVEMRLVPARDHRAMYAVFADFQDAAGFAYDLTASDVRLRLCSLHQAPIGSMLKPLAGAYDPADHVLLLWADAAHVAKVGAMARRYGGRLEPDWPAKTHITQFPFSHTILWSRKADPGSSWLQCEYSDDRERFLGQTASVSERYPGVFLQHIEFIESAGRIRPLGIPPLVGLPDHEAALEELMAYCAGLGITLLNPHSYIVEEGGFVGDTAQVATLKQTSDPYHILNPGKLGEGFFTSRGPTPPSLRTRTRSKEKRA
ncbi:FAD-binding oxidoreductase [Actinomadura viridis]|uniref:FAD/FMN-containing dehydrogenase n=1 Tax=Actinomadura viridis TaxID=58110 RepID=A0A931GPE3_9ACTN|nr:FAD-binding oxidoreductase [Actinomadura viridis]MBG6090531.1 FAD/FMN-containing dehydrogenase [Actinomadura viridis]